MRHDQIFRAPTLREGSESLREFAHNAGMDNPTHEWLLDSRDVWVKNPYYHGEPGLHPEDDRGEYEHYTQEVAPYVAPRPIDNEDDIPF